MNTKHTPEPWITGEPYGPLMTEILNEDGSKVIAVVFTHRHTSWSGDTRSQAEQWAEGQANLVLIKAAPRLLNALEGLLACINAIEAGEQDWFHYHAASQDALAATEEAQP